MSSFSSAYRTSFNRLQGTANYILSLLVVYEVDYPGGMDYANPRWRALIWIVSEGLLLISIAINYLPPRLYSAVFKFSALLMMVDFLLCVIWLPIGVSRTYGFRSAEDVFTQVCEYTYRQCLNGRAHSHHLRQRDWRAVRVELDFVLPVYRWYSHGL